MRSQAVLTVVRDTLCLVWGFGGIAIQQYTGNVSIPLLTVYITMIGAPGGLALAQLLRGSTTTAPTPGSSQSPPPRSSLPRSSGLGDEA